MLFWALLICLTPCFGITNDLHPFAAELLGTPVLVFKAAEAPEVLKRLKAEPLLRDRVKNDDAIIAGLSNAMDAARQEAVNMRAQAKAEAYLAAQRQKKTVLIAAAAGGGAFVAGVLAGILISAIR